MGIVDTCTLLWLVSDQTALTKNAATFLKHHAGKLFVSAISAFEIAIKQHKNILKLPCPTLRWYHEALEFHGLRELPLSGDIGIRAAELPYLHRDPADRIIVATAQEHDLTVITPDPLIAQYRVTTVW